MIFRQLSAIMLLAVMFPVSVAHAIPVYLDFSVTGFGESSGNAAPTDPVVGSIIYEAASVDATIDSITSISLTLNGYTYGISNLYFGTASGTLEVIAGEGGIGLGNLTDDFEISFYRDTGTGGAFTYTSSTLSGIWFARNFTSFSLTTGPTVPAPAPAPLPVALLLIGLVAMGYKKYVAG